MRLNLSLAPLSNFPDLGPGTVGLTPGFIWALEPSPLLRSGFNDIPSDLELIYLVFKLNLNYLVNNNTYIFKNMENLIGSSILLLLLKIDVVKSQPCWEILSNP